MLKLNKGFRSGNIGKVPHVLIIDSKGVFYAGGEWKDIVCWNLNLLNVVGAIKNTE